MDEHRSERIGIIGTGALGGYFGIRLASAGWPVSFLVRSDFAAVREHGWHLTLAGGEEQVVERPAVFDRPETMGRQDWVIIGLKSTRNALFGRLLPPVVGPRTILVTVQNGLGNVEALRALFPVNPLIGALCQIGVNREGPGRIRSFVPGDGFIQIGVADGTDPACLAACEQLFTSAGLHVKRTASLGEALWRKLMWNVPFNGLTVTMGGKGTDAVCGDPALRVVARALMEEIRLAGNALGYPIEPAYTDKLLAFTDKLGSYMSSSVLDWRAGRPLEVEAIFQKPLLAGRQAGVPMPRLEALVEKLLALDH